MIPMIALLLQSKPERLATYKHFSLLGLLSSYEENNVLQISSSQHLIFVLTYEWSQ